MFKTSDTPYLQLACDDIKSAICKSNDVIKFEQAYEQAFNGFEDHLRKELIENAETVEVSKEETAISENIFARLADIQLVDKYEAYQLLDDEWGKIAVDLEIIQTEGFEATRKVDPNIVIKKKDGKDTLFLLSLFRQRYCAMSITLLKPRNADWLRSRQSMSKFLRI